jgi:arabinofuranan 3-O-arabinosyltransferase
MTLRAALGRHLTALGVALLALLAYLPALASSPGRMPADTKLYLYFDPGRLLARAASTFEPDQFAGWVPHQQITYLWPGGPWYLLFEHLAVPDWVAQRLWIGTIMFLAGVGVLWAARLLGITRIGAIAAAMVYQLSPFLLPYISRTSLLLLPWAGLGWIVALTVRAAEDIEPATGWRDRLLPWREPALIALVVATIGSANVTTLLMIVPAPVLWIVHIAWQRQITWRRALGIATRTAVLCLAVSIWWMAMSWVQSKHGAPVLSYSETLGDVSRNATGPETLRGLGYWLFYQRDPFGPTTTASLDYLVSSRTIAVSYAVILVGMVGLAVTWWRHRRFAALCVAAGLVLAVGVHPIGSPSPLMNLLVNDNGSGLALALRSSTRAIPVFLLGISLGAGALVSALPRRIPRLAHVDMRLVGAGAVALLAVVNMPSLWQRAFVDPAIDRDQDPPAAWNAAIDQLDRTDPRARVLQEPGAEFGAFRWGYTVDPPLVGLTHKPLVTRDLLPLGSPGAMDLLFALDDRFQEGTIEPSSVAPVARLLGADTLWLSDDAAFERFRTARPEVVDAALTGDPAADGLGPVQRFGDPVVNTPEVAMIDPAALVEPSVGQPLAPVALVPIDDPVSVIRAKTDSVVVSGSGDGLVDAAAAGLLSGHELIQYSGSLQGDALTAALGSAGALIVTDTNRDQAHHWRGSQDVRGHTEPGGPAIDVLDPTTADQRLPVFASDAGLQTVAIQVGPVSATASSYGEPFAYRPEDRAVFAIDGDPTTAWTVADHGDPVGERIRLDVAADAGGPVQSLRLVQPAPAAGGRTIASVRVTVDGSAPFDVTLDDTSLSETGQQVPIPALAAGGSVTIEITGIVAGRFPLAASFAGVGFSEIDLGLGATTEVIRVPIDALAAVQPDTPVALVFTRWRTDPTDPWRSDPEPDLRRRFDIATTRTFDPTVALRLDRRATDGALADLLADATSVPTQTPIAGTRVTGGVAQRGVAAADGDTSTSWITGFDDAVGSSLRFDAIGPLGSDLVIDQPTGSFSPITGVRLDDGTTSAELVVPAPDQNGRSIVALPPGFAGRPAGPLTVTITSIDARTTIDRRYGDPRTLPAAIAELTGTTGIEPVEIDRAAPIDVECSPDFLTVDGTPVPISFATTVGTLIDGDVVEARACAPLTLSPGTHDLVADNAGPISVDRVVLAEVGLPGPATPDSAVAVDVTRNDPRARDVTVAACPQGCWVVLGEGFNTAWRASAGGTSLGAPTLVDGGFNGWWLPASDSPTTVTFRWTAQGPVTAGLAISLFGVIVCAAIAVLAPRRRFETTVAPRIAALRRPGPGSRRIVHTGAVLVGASTMLIGPLWGAIALVPFAIAYLASRANAPISRIFELTGVVLAVAVAVSVLWIERRERPYPNAGWTIPFDHLNGLALFAVLALTVGTVLAADADAEAR